MPPSTFQKTATALTTAQERVDALEQNLLQARANLTVKFADHAKHWQPQAKLAEKMGITAPYLSDILKGKRGVSKATATRLLGASLEK